MRRTEMYVLLGVLALILTVGFTTSFESFAENMLASTADLILGVFVALYLVDRITRREKNLKWQRVKGLCYRSIESTADLIMFAFEADPGIYFKTSPLALARETKRKEHRLRHQAFFSLGEEIARRADELCHGDCIVVDPSFVPRGAYAKTEGGITTVRSQKYADQLLAEQQHRISSQILLTAVQPHFEKFSLYIFPRIMDLDEQEDLAASLIDVEYAYQEWTSTVDTIEGGWGMPEEYAWKAVAEFCDRMGAMLKIVHFAGSGSPHKHSLSSDATG